VHLREPHRAAGYLDLEHADVQWFLSTDSADLPFAPVPGGRSTFRSITVDGAEVEFSEGFTDLHTRIYQDILAGGGFGIDAARPSIELTSGIRSAAIRTGSSRVHPKAVVHG
jgi:UDP-N-acetyl-2-amino-2-deoxyglucuronate dehydrogenase